MSQLYDQIIAVINAGTLLKASSLLGQEAESTRIMLLLPHVYSVCNHGGGDRRYTPEVLSKIRVQIENFIFGEPLLCFEDIKPLQPYGLGVWEFRFRFKPHIRLLGCFVEADIFVGVDIYVHKDLDAPSRLRNEPNWASAIRSVPKKLNAVLPSADPINGPDCKKAASNVIPGGD